ncbi:MAG: DUF523 domain-containing protein [Syntrophales bacterium]|nr:DUF523 domain-containing protein [Syntrophales bacterium]
MNKIRLGISACLLGQKVRYNGDHKSNFYIREILNKHFSWLATCPETEAGLGVPREAIRFVQTEKGELRLKTVESGRDVTFELEKWIGEKIGELAKEQIAGFILKAKSPSCSVRARCYIYNERGIAISKTAGLFALAVKKNFPWLPMIEESDIGDDQKWNAFLDELATYTRFCRESERGWNIKSLERFHNDHRLLLTSYDPRQREKLDRLVKELKKEWRRGAENEYYAHVKAIFLRRPSKINQLECLKTVKDELVAHLEKGEIRQIESRFHSLDEGKISAEVLRKTLARYIKKHRLKRFYSDTFLFPPRWRSSIPCPHLYQEKN